MSEITYIIGAGASFESIPIVNKFNTRLKEFAEYIRNIGYNDYSDDTRSKFNDASEKINVLYNEFSSHQSFDTYFKKLFHLGKQEEINNGKRLLNLYFIWEHSIESLKFFPSNPEMEGFTKKSLSDKRYDALIAGLLKPNKNKLETICKVNIISWNYDLNLLQCIKNFFYPKDSYSDFFSKISQNEYYWEIANQIKIININGCFYSSQYDSSNNFFNLNAREILKKLILNNFHNEMTSNSDADRLKFSWERDAENLSSVIKVLNECVYNSNNVIVIGYTFPLYNRFIDLQYLNESFFANIVNRYKRLVIQNPKAAEMLEIIEDMSSQKYKFEMLNIVRPGCDSFFVPSLLFSNDNKEFAAEIITKSR